MQAERYCFFGNERAAYGCGTIIRIQSRTHRRRLPTRSSTLSHPSSFSKRMPSAAARPSRDLQSFSLYKKKHFSIKGEMQVKFLTIWMILLVGGSCMVMGTAASHRARHGGCNFRIVRDIMRRACAYHSSENSQLLGIDELGPASVARSSNMLDEVVDHHHHDKSGSRVKKEIELLYIRRILKECCPNEGCPPLSKFCR